MCWALNHQNTLEMAQGHISLSTHQKATKRSATSMHLRTKIVFDSNLAYLDHTLPPHGLFLQIKFIFLSLSQTHLFGHKERYFKSENDQD
jgi:hypothetical protein